MGKGILHEEEDEPPFYGSERKDGQGDGGADEAYQNLDALKGGFVGKTGGHSGAGLEIEGSGVMMSVVTSAPYLVSLSGAEHNLDIASANTSGVPASLSTSFGVLPLRTLPPLSSSIGVAMTYLFTGSTIVSASLFTAPDAAGSSGPRQLEVIPPVSSCKGGGSMGIISIEEDESAEEAFIRELIDNFYRRLKHFSYLIVGGGKIPLDTLLDLLNGSVAEVRLNSGEVHATPLALLVKRFAHLAKGWLSWRYRDLSSQVREEVDRLVQEMEATRRQAAEQRDLTAVEIDCLNAEKVCRAEDRMAVELEASVIGSDVETTLKTVEETRKKLSLAQKAVEDATALLSKGEEMLESARSRQGLVSARLEEFSAAEATAEQDLERLLKLKADGEAESKEAAAAAREIIQKQVLNKLEDERRAHMDRLEEGLALLWE